MKKFLSLTAILAVVAMFSGVAFAEGDEGRVAKLGSEVSFVKSGITASVKLKKISDNSETGSILWDAESILKDNNKWHTATVYAEVTASFDEGAVGSPVLMMIQSNKEGSGEEDAPYRATTKRSQNLYGTSYDLYSGLVKKNSGGGANGYVPMAWFISNSLTTNHVFSNPETDAQTRYLIDENDSVIERDSSGEMLPVSVSRMNYVTIMDKDGFAYIQSNGTNPITWNDATAAAQYRHLSGITDNTAYIYFGGQFANAEANTIFGTTRILIQIVSE